MEIETMGKVTVPARIENLWDVYDLRRQAIADEEVRVVDPAGQKLVGNPDHGGEQMIDLF